MNLTASESQRRATLFLLKCLTNLRTSSHEAIFFLIRATSALIASVTKDDADPKEVAEAFGKTFSRHIAQDIQDERDRRAEETEKAKGGEKRDSFVCWRPGSWRLWRFLRAGHGFRRRYADCKTRRNRPGRRPLEGGRPVAVSETWRDVPGYGGKYQASDMGHIANTFWHGQKRKNGGRTILTQYKRKPRGKAKLQSAKRYVHLTDLEGNMREFSAAKIVAETIPGASPSRKSDFSQKSATRQTIQFGTWLFCTRQELGRMTGADSSGGQC